MTTIGHDAARGGWAWVVADHNGPTLAHWVAVGHLAQPWTALERYIREVYLPALKGAAEAGPVHVVVEVPGVYEGGQQAGKSQAQRTGFGMGLAVGPVLLASASVGEPSTVTPDEWRKEWGIRGKREACKAAAVATVRLMAPRLVVSVAGWQGGLKLEPTPFRELTVDQQGDVAEAVLIAVGAARKMRMLENRC